MSVNKAGFGGGVGHLAVPLIAMVMPAREAVAVTLPTLVVTDAICLVHYWRAWHLRNVLTLGAGCLVGIVIGTCILDMISETELRRGIGVLALTYGALQMPFARGFRERHLLAPGWKTGVGAGVLTGTVSTLAHLGGLVTAMFLLPQRLSNRTFVATTTLLYLAVNTLKLGPYVLLGMMPQAVWYRAFTLLPAVLVGTVLGFVLNKRPPTGWFQWIIFGCIMVVGTSLLFR